MIGLGGAVFVFLNEARLNIHICEFLRILSWSLTKKPCYWCSCYWSPVLSITPGTRVPSSACVWPLRALQAMGSYKSEDVASLKALEDWGQQRPDPERHVFRDSPDSAVLGAGQTLVWGGAGGGADPLFANQLWLFRFLASLFRPCFLMEVFVFLHHPRGKAGKGT